MDGVVNADSIQPVRIGDVLIGPGSPVFIIAEAGVNHSGAPDLAVRLVDAAADAGADAVKFQTFRAAAVATPAAPMAAYQARPAGAAGSQLDLLARLELSVEGHRRAAARCRERGIVFLSSPADPPSADLLREIGVPAFKVGSGNLTNNPLLEHLARTGRPLIISTGMATLDEVAVAVAVARAAGARELVVLHCVSEYPADPAAVNLRAMATMREAFAVPVGYSDHTLGAEVSLAAVALGACVIEKHLTLDRSLPGPDHQASLEPVEFTALVRSVRTVEACLGDGVKRPSPAEEATRAVVRKSLVAAVAIPAGTLVTPELLAVRRPGTGMAPGRMGEVVGRRSRCGIPAGTLLAPEMVE